LRERDADLESRLGRVEGGPGVETPTASDD
jgi:hypothetical protein